MTLCIVIYNYMVNNEEARAVLVSWPAGSWETMTKFICSVVLHLYLQPKLR